MALTATADQAAADMQEHMAVVVLYLDKVIRAAAATQVMPVVAAVAPEVEVKTILEVILEAVAELDYLVLFQVPQLLVLAAEAAAVMVTDNLLLLKEIREAAATAQHIVLGTEFKAAAETTAAVAAAVPIQYTGQAAAAALV
jgi:hypothetical protein